MKNKLQLAKGLMGFFLLSSFGLYAQFDDGLWTGKQANNWYWSFGQGLTFNSGSPQFAPGGQTAVMEGTAVMSDQDGQLLFYASNGTVWNKNHVQMLNGDNILSGTQSSTQSGIIVPKPGAENVYYLFNIDVHDGLVYSEVDMSLDNGLGAVTTNKNIVLADEARTEKITAVYHADKEQIWLVAHRAHNNEFIAFLISETGIATPVTSAVGISYTTATPAEGPYVQEGPAGQLKASPDGTKLAAVQREGELVGSGFINGKVEVFDFNNTTGIVSNVVQITMANSAYGVEFSPNSRFLYVLNDDYRPWVGALGTTFEKLYQFDVESANIPASAVLIGEYTSRYPSALQLGPDGKVYMMNSAGLNTMVAVGNPNNPGTAAGFQTNVVTLINSDSIGMPTFNQSYFQSGILYQEDCNGPVNFTLLRIPGVTGVAWNFGDPNSGADNASAEPQHTFSAPGTYTVTAVITSNGATQTATAQVVVTGGVALTQPQNLIQCIATGSNTAVFDLTVQEAVILAGLNADDYAVGYYPSELDAQNGTNAFAAPDSFTSGGQVIYVGITNLQNGCTGTTAFGLVLSPVAPVPVLPQLSQCSPDNDGTAMFNLTVQELLLSPDNFPVLYFTTQEDAEANTNFIPFAGAFINSQNPQTIYVRSGMGDCYAVTSFEVVVPDGPTPDIEPLLTGCPPFNLADALGESQDGLQFTYYASEANAENGVDAIENPQAYNFEGAQAIVYIRAQNEMGCTAIFPLGLMATGCDIPKGISPDGDTKNDTFDLTGFNVQRLTIYNRYGMEVYALNNYTTQWHGQDAKDNNLPSGVYYYVMQPLLGNYKTGWVYVNYDSE